MQNFLRQGALPPYNPRQGASLLDPCEHLTHRLSHREFKMEWRPCCDSIFHFLVISPVRKVGEGGRTALHPIFDDSRWKWATQGNLKLVESMESLVEMVQIENSLRNYVNFTLGNGFSWAFKTLKPISFRELRPLDPWCQDGISDENGTILWFSTKFYSWSYPLKQIFLGF